MGGIVIGFLIVFLRILLGSLLLLTIIMDPSISFINYFELGLTKPPGIPSSAICIVYNLTLNSFPINILVLHLSFGIIISYNLPALINQLKIMIFVSIDYFTIFENIACNYSVHLIKYLNIIINLLSFIIFFILQIFKI